MSRLLWFIAAALLVFNTPLISMADSSVAALDIELPLSKTPNQNKPSDEGESDSETKKSEFEDDFLHLFAFEANNSTRKSYTVKDDDKHPSPYIEKFLRPPRS